MEAQTTPASLLYVYAIGFPAREVPEQPMLYHRGDGIMLVRMSWQQSALLKPEHHPANASDGCSQIYLPRNDLDIPDRKSGTTSPEMCGQVTTTTKTT